MTNPANTPPYPRCPAPCCEEGSTYSRGGRAAACELCSGLGRLDLATIIDVANFVAAYSDDVMCRAHDLSAAGPVIAHLIANRAPDVAMTVAVAAVLDDADNYVYYCFVRPQALAAQYGVEVAA